MLANSSAALKETFTVAPWAWKLAVYLGCDGIYGTWKWSLSAPFWGFWDNLFVVVEQPVVLTHDPAALWPPAQQLYPRVREKGFHSGNIQNTGKSRREGGQLESGSKTPHKRTASGYWIHNLTTGNMRINATSSLVLGGFCGASEWIKRLIKMGGRAFPSEPAPSLDLRNGHPLCFYDWTQTFMEK